MGKSVQAVIFAGGLGTRLRPLTLKRPKVLLPVCNKPLLQRQIGYLTGLADEVILAAGWMHDQIAAWVSTSSLPMEVTVVKEDEPLGTGGALANLRERVSGDFLAMNGDILTDASLSELYRTHRRSGELVTIATAGVPDASRFGTVSVRDGRIIRFLEKIGERREGIANAGLYVINPEALELLPPGKSSLEQDLFPRLAETGRLADFRIDCHWTDVGTLISYLLANMRYAETEPSGRVGAGAMVKGEVDSLSCIGEGCQIAQGSRVLRSVLLEGARVGRGAVIEDSVIGEFSSVPDGDRMASAVLTGGEASPIRRGV